MSVAGVVTGVAHKAWGTSLVESVVEQTVLPVEGVYDFNSGGGQLLLNDQVLDYLSTDTTTSTITLAEAVTADEGDRAEQLVGDQVGTSYIAYVAIDGTGEDLGEDLGEAIEIELPFAERDAWPEGDYEPPVPVHLDDTMTTIVSVDGYAPVRDGSFIDPDTLPPVEPGYTEAPGEAPVIEVLPGSGAAVVRWGPVDRAEWYNLYVTKDAGAPVDESTLYMANVSSPTWVAELSGVGLPLDADTYFALEAESSVGKGPASAWTAGRPGPLADNLLSASLVLAQEVVARLVETQGLKIGDQTWNSTTGLTIPNVVNFPIGGEDVAKVWAKLVARSLLVENFFKLMGKINEISIGSSMALAQGVSDPEEEPTVSPIWETTELLGMTPDEADLVRGIHRNADGSWVVLVSRPDSGSSTLIAFDTEADEVSRLDMHNAQDGAGGLVKAGTHFYVLSSPQDISSRVSWGQVFEVNEALTTVTKSFQVRTSRTGWAERGQFAAWQIGPHPGNLAGGISVGGWTPSEAESRRFAYLIPAANGATVEWSGTDLIPNPTNKGYNIKGLTYGAHPGSTDGFSEFAVWSGGNNPKSDAGGTDPDTWVRAYGDLVRAAFVDDSGVYSVNAIGQIYRYQRTQPTGQVAYSWRDSDPAGTGEHETGLSPAVTLNIPLGAGFRVEPTTFGDTGDPDSPNVSTVYGKSGASLWYQQGDATIDPVLGGNPAYLAYGITLSGTAHGSRPDFESAQLDSAEFYSSKTQGGSPVIDLWGAGKGRTGPWRWDNNGNLLLPDGSAAADTGWLAASGEFTGSLRFLRFDDVVIMQGVLVKPGHTTNAYTATGIVVPVGLRPAVTQVLPTLRAAPTSTVYFNYRVLTNGVVDVRVSENPTTWNLAASASYFVA